MRLPLLYSALAHLVLAGAFRALVWYQEIQILDAPQSRLEFSVTSVETRAATRRRPVPAAEANKTTRPPDESTGAQSSDDQQATEDFIPVGRAGRGPRWISGHITRADYPPSAEAQGLETIVRALVYINRNGTVFRVRILKGHPEFHETVRRKLEAARFSPAIDAESGRPVAVRLILPIEFRLR